MHPRLCRDVGCTLRMAWKTQIQTFRSIGKGVTLSPMRLRHAIPHPTPTSGRHRPIIRTAPGLDEKKLADVQVRISQKPNGRAISWMRPNQVCEIGHSTNACLDPESCTSSPEPGREFHAFSGIFLPSVRLLALHSRQGRGSSRVCRGKEGGDYWPRG